MDQNYYNVGVYSQPNVPQEPQPNQEKKGVMGVISLILGIISIPATCCFGAGSLFGIPAIILGAISQKKDSKGKIGMILGIVGSALSVIAGIVAICIIALSGVNTQGSDYDDYDMGAVYDYDDDYDDWLDTDVYDTTEWGDTDAEEVNEVDRYTPSYAVMQIGNDDTGYSYVPEGWIGFHEIGGTGFTYTVQVANQKNATEIVNLSAMSPEELREGANAYGLAVALENGEKTNPSVDPSSVYMEPRTYGEISGYYLESYYTADDMYLYRLTFDGSDGKLHYISVEVYADSEYSDLFETVAANFSYDGSVTIDNTADSNNVADLTSEVIASDNTTVTIHTAPEGYEVDSTYETFSFFENDKYDMLIYKINWYTSQMTVDEYLDEHIETSVYDGELLSKDVATVTDTSGREWTACAYSYEAIGYTTYELVYATKLTNGEIVSIAFDSVDSPFGLNDYTSYLEPNCLEIVE